MADYDSDSSGADDVETNCLLGYASPDPTGDSFSQLGGHPIWLDNKTTPSGSMVQCRVCNGWMNLVLQLHGDIPEKFPGHERRLYLWTCRRKPCRRKNGSVRAFRAVVATGASLPAPDPETAKPATKNLGETLFGVKQTSGVNAANPFSTAPDSQSSTNPFSSAPSSSSQDPDPATTSLSETFAQKARISSSSNTSNSPPTLATPWPEQSDFPTPFTTYYIDADKEYLASDFHSNAALSNLKAPTAESSAGPSSSADVDMKDAFESSMDKTFQRFADRLAQNPEQVLRYEFAGQPLLYSRSDAVGKTFGGQAARGENEKVKVVSNGTAGSGIPGCENCGAQRVFELQITPHAIAMLEADEMGIDGMDWGTILLGVCSQDCVEKGKRKGELGYVEEWVGVQWEELENKKG